MFILIAAAFAVVAAASSFVLPLPLEQTSSALGFMAGSSWTSFKHFCHKKLQLSSLKPSFDIHVGSLRACLMAYLPNMPEYNLDVVLSIASFMVFLAFMIYSMTKTRSGNHAPTSASEQSVITHDTFNQTDNHYDDDNISESSSTTSDQQPTTTVYNITNNFRAPITNLFLGGFGAGEQSALGRFEDRMADCSTERLLELDDENDDSEDYEGSDAGDEVEELLEAQVEESMVA